jgi:hypothetical protein
VETKIVGKCTSMKRLYSAWYLPCILFVLLQYSLWSWLDLSDLPGAAGTLHLYEAMQGSNRADEMSSLYIWMSSYGYPLSASMWIFSILGVAMGFVGALLGSWAYGGVRGVRDMAWLLLFWPPIHLYGWLIGVDSLVFGLSFFGAGLIWASFRYPIWGCFLLLPAGMLLTKAISMKLMAAPILLCSLLAVFNVQKLRWAHLLPFILILGVVYGALPEFSSDGSLQGGLRIPEVDWLPVAMGWDRLRTMPAMGMPEGKWDQLIGLCLLGGIFVRGQYGIRLLGIILAVLVLVVSAFVLEDRLGTRLLVPASFAVLVFLPTVFRKFSWLLPIVVVGLGLEMWAFVDQFQERRALWAKSKMLPIPTAPRLWRSQYPENPTIFKGLSLYGGGTARSIIEESSSSMMYSMRLRDGREKSLFVYAEFAGKKGRTLDVSSCCVRSVDDSCARQVVSSILSKGGMLIVPTVVEGWERVYSNEQRWNKALLKAMRQQEITQEDESWAWSVGTKTTDTEEWPCTQNRWRR